MILVIIVITVTKVIMASMIKVVIKDRCVLKKWALLNIHYHVLSSFGAKKVKFKEEQMIVTAIAKVRLSVFATWQPEPAVYV